MPTQARKMRRRRRLSRRQSRLDRFAVGALTLSAGLLLVSVFINVELYKSAPGGNAIRPEPGARSQIDRQARQLSLAQQNTASSVHDSDAANVSIGSLDKTTQADHVRAQRPTPELSNSNARLGRESSKSPDTSNDAAKTLRQTNVPAQPQAQAGDYDVTTPSVSDTAPLETTREMPVHVSSPYVARAQFTTGIRGLEPIDRVESVFPMPGKLLRTLYYFTEITNMGGDTVTHRWQHEGTVMAEVTLAIGSDRWRTWSSKDLVPSMEGRWRVAVIDMKGNIIKTDSFLYQSP
jgi:hypothetical protein